MTDPLDGLDPQQVMDRYWTGRAEEYDAHQRRQARAEADHRVWTEVLSGALPPGRLDVLDLGTGTGYVALLLADLGHRVTGVDSSAGMLAVARRHAARATNPPCFVQGDAVRPPVAPGSVDAVTSRYLMWTLRSPAEALARWHALLRPGGRLVLVDAPWFADGIASSAAGFDDHYRRADVAGALPLARAASATPLVELVRAAGFEDVECTALDEVYRLDVELGTAPGHAPVRQHLVTGSRPRGRRSPARRWAGMRV